MLVNAKDSVKAVSEDDEDLQFDQISIDELLSDDSDMAPDEDLDKVLKSIQQKQLRKPG